MAVPAFEPRATFAPRFCGTILPRPFRRCPVRRGLMRSVEPAHGAAGSYGAILRGFGSTNPAPAQWGHRILQIWFRLTPSRTVVDDPPKTVGSRLPCDSRASGEGSGTSGRPTQEDEVRPAP